MSELPARRWELSAPESQVLLTGPETTGDLALKAALLELVVRRVLRLASVEYLRLLVFKGRADVLVRDVTLPPREGREQSPDPSASRALQVVLDAYRNPRTYPDGTIGCPVEKFAHAVLTRWPRGYVHGGVFPALERRGLFAWEGFGPVGVVLTAEGFAALADLRALLATGRGAFRAWVIDDPERARAFVDLAGPALLLLDDLTPALRKIGRSGIGDSGFDECQHERDRRTERANLPPTAGAFTVAALAGQFGPGPSDGLDSASFAIAAGVDRAWEALRRASSGDGG